jgi:hypothetical protein
LDGPRSLCTAPFARSLFGCWFGWIDSSLCLRRPIADPGAFFDTDRNERTHHSPDSRQIACIHFPGKDPRVSSALLAVTRIDGNGGFTTFPRSYRDETTISWSPDGKGIDFVMRVNGAGNIWRQPLKGGSPVQITHFDRDDLIRFAWSRDGRLLCTRGNTAHTAILIQNFR